MASQEVKAQAAAGFRKHLPDLNTPRFQTAAKQSPYEYAAEFQETQHPPWIYRLTKAWEELLEQPYQGVTTDGKVIEGLFEQRDEGVQIEGIVAAVDAVLGLCTDAEKEKLRYPLASKAWRSWSNPEFLLRPFGLRLEEVSESLAQSILAVLKATFSEEGYAKALGAMHTNHFLGDLCQVPRIMNKYSYNFLLFGTPSADEPWGWSLYGHHLCLNVYLHGRQIFISPTFTGAEPNCIDEGPYAGTAILSAEGDLGLQLMQSLRPEDQEAATIFKELKDERMLITGGEDLKVDRWNQDDQRHVCGAFRDNRTVPYEGLCARTLTPAQKSLLLSIVKEFVLYLPAPARDLRLQDVERHMDETWFCWIGGHGDEDAFYYRIQSPVIICEFDHHSGVFLSNSEPAKFHVHTLVRTPNRGDYGDAVRRKEDRVP
jgi:hypothetical protein